MPPEAPPACGKDRVAGVTRPSCSWSWPPRGPCILGARLGQSCCRAPGVLGTRRVDGRRSGSAEREPGSLPGPPGSEMPANPHHGEAALGSTSGPRSAGDRAWLCPSRELGIPRVAEGRVGGTTAEMRRAPGRVEQGPPPHPNHRHLAPCRRPAPPAAKRAAARARPAPAPPPPRLHVDTAQW